MKKTFLIIIFLMFSFPAFSLFSPVKGIESANIRRVAIDPFSSNRIYVASARSLYEKTDAA